MVTGANVGLGYWTALHLARNDAKVIMTCRNNEKCAAAAATIRANYTGADLVTMHLDTSSLKSVEKFGKEFLGKFKRLDTFIMNAGVGASPRGFLTSEDGFELMFATNHLGHFKLYNDIKSVIESTAKEQGVATIVAVSSGAHYGHNETVGGGSGVFDSLEELNDPVTSVGMAGYGQSKLFNILFANELSDRYKDSGLNILCNSVHPGLVDTNFAQERIDQINELPSWMVPPLMALVDLVKSGMWTGEEGALTQIFTAVSHEVISKKLTGNYYHPIALIVPPHVNVNKKNQIKLWLFSEKLLKSKGY